LVGSVKSFVLMRIKILDTTIQYFEEKALEPAQEKSREITSRETLIYTCFKGLRCFWEIFGVKVLLDFGFGGFCFQT
jgi:hypothetical protein